MDFFIKKNATLPLLKLQVVNNYQLNSTDTNRVGKYEGQFLLRSDEGVLILPIREKLNVYVQESFIANDLDYETCYVSEFPCCVNGPYITTTTTTPCPSCGPQPTPTPTISVTPTRTPTPTPTPSSTPSQEILDNPILIGVDTYLSVGENQYLTF